MYLYDAAGNLLDQNLVIDVIFPAAGDYVVGLAGFSSFDAGGQIGGGALQLGDVYSLNISVENHPFTPAPNDNFSFTLKKGDSATVALTGSLDLDLQLLDAAGNIVAEDLGPTQSVIENGSFETGDFTGWTVVETDLPFFPWTVSGPGDGSGFFPPTEPQDGNFVAWNGFDGFGPMEFQMYQDFTIPADAQKATLEWQDRVQWDFTFGDFASLPRTYQVQVRDPLTGGILDDLFSFSTGTEDVNPTGDTGWQTHSADLSAFIGEHVRLYFVQHIPQALTGPGQIEFDGIRLELDDRPTNVDNLIRNFVASETETYTAVVSGDANTDYSLVVTRNSEFELEDNNSIDSAQEILSSRANGRQWVLGHTGGAAGSLYGSSR